MGLKELADIKRVEILLDKYFRGDSTREEEAVLREYFAGEKVVDHLKYIRPLFVALQQNREQRLESDFDQDLLQKVNAKRTGAVHKVRRLFSRNITKIAASLVLVLAVTYWFQAEYKDRDNDNVEEQLGTFESPEEAYEQVKKSLQLVSTKLNKGNNYMKELSKFNKGATLFNKQKKQKTQD